MNTHMSIQLEEITGGKCLSYGCISLGFVYHLKVTLTNAYPFSQRYRCCISSDLTPDNNDNPNEDIATNPSIIDKSMRTTYEESNEEDEDSEQSVPENNAAFGYIPTGNDIRVIAQTKLIAPGMKHTIILELYANLEKYSKYKLCIHQSNVSEILEYDVRAFIVPPDIYKSFRKVKHVYGKDMIVQGVKLIRSIYVDSNDKSIISSVSSINSIAFTDEENFEEVMDYPIVGMTYWDPYTKTLRIDDQLTQVRS